MMIHERLSIADDTMLASYAEHIQRYEFALPFCQGARVLDAGCGTGYGARFLAANGAASVVAVDISEAALAEAEGGFALPNLRFERRDVETLADDPALVGRFDVVVNFENLEHVPHPERLIASAAEVLKPGGRYITSTPNGEISDRDARGKPVNPFHVEEYTQYQLETMLAGRFPERSYHGQWLTHSGRLRKIRARELFDQLCEAYYNPANRLGRAIRRLAGRPAAAPPRFTAGMDHYPGDHAIAPIASVAFPWPAEVLIAVARLAP
jgi:2-polyprenyl-3-methyl-5-hydroxy-6-metoxy-1,4-benzoquinol methylase